MIHFGTWTISILPSPTEPSSMSPKNPWIYTAEWLAEMIPRSCFSLENNLACTSFCCPAPADLSRNGAHWQVTFNVVCNSLFVQLLSTEICNPTLLSFHLPAQNCTLLDCCRCIGCLFYPAFYFFSTLSPTLRLFQHIWLTLQARLHSGSTGPLPARHLAFRSRTQPTDWITSPIQGHVPRSCHDSALQITAPSWTP